ncbi:acyl carrier protein [Marinobacter sp.]|uniref:acyl carrier protein n=1 Tax=Marinobacter sp. TaxID=50741 RepID=UPI00384C4587
MSTETTPSLDQLLSEVAMLLNKDVVSPDEPMVELGVDSMTVVELIMICEQIYPSMDDPEALQFDEFTTLRELDNKLMTQAA